MLSRSTSTNWSCFLCHALDTTLLASKGSKSGDQAKTCVLQILLYWADTWTLLADDTRRLQSFLMSCQCQILGVKWQDHVKNVDIADRTGLPNTADIISKRRQALFGHIVRLDATTPAHQALCQVIAMKGGQSLGINWRRPPGRFWTLASWRQMAECRWTWTSWKVIAMDLSCLHMMMMMICATSPTTLKMEFRSVHCYTNSGIWFSGYALIIAPIGIASSCVHCTCHTLTTYLFHWFLHKLSSPATGKKRIADLRMSQLVTLNFRCNSLA